MRNDKDLQDRGRENEAKGTGEKMKGRAKDAAGSLTGNRRLEGEGKADQVRGEARKQTGKMQKEAGKSRDSRV